MGYAYGCGIQLIGLILFFVLLDTSFTIALIVLLVLGMVGFLFGITKQYQKLNVLKNEILNKVESVNPSVDNFKESKSFVAFNQESKIAIDEEKKKVCIWVNKESNFNKIQSANNKYEFSYKVYDYADILSAEVLKDGKSITTTSRGSQIGGALVGGALLGGVGAVIGGLSGSNTTTEKITSVELGITVNDFENPYYKINFFTTSFLVDGGVTNSINYDALSECKKWFGILSFLIKKVDNEDAKEDDRKHFTQLALTTQLKELNELKEQGILTDDEFQQQKTKLLNA